MHATERGMHALSFRFKRAHWAAVKIGKLVVSGIAGMTPARFDLMYLVRRVRLEDPLLHPDACVKRQDELSKELGVHRTTVSKMLARLLEMGWVMRSRSAIDRRRWLIGLTELGLRMVVKAMRLLFRGRQLLGMYERVLPTTPSAHVVERIHRLVTILKAVAYALGDRGDLWFDYGHAKANLRVVQLTEPRSLRWIRLARERTAEVAAAAYEDEACRATAAREGGN